ncbi:MAG TPA: glutamate-cysteine ligase family protein [Blastocatellia bacterium]|nr:glutamate-cysteine ligase family protein [Blastocatellia bacterium]
MGEHDVAIETGEDRLRTFTRALLSDLQALEYMLETGMIESGVHRIGAEQEMFLVNWSHRPAPIAVELLERLNDPRFTTEMGRFNLEANLPPLDFDRHCLRDLEGELRGLVAKVNEAAKPLGAYALLTGILPTMRLSDLTLDNLTPTSRYSEMNRAITNLRGGSFNIQINGLDELQITHDNVMLESCNTSFQIHLQAGPREFVELYNLAQVVIAPVLAAAVNSPLLLGHRLWHETRVALFQHSVDGRSAVQQARSYPTRVRFGDDWVRDSIIEVFHEDVSRFRVILTRELEQDSMAVLAAGAVPSLPAWRLHNGTVWRWNRACYGVMNERPHLRIEARALPSGPSIIDEVANAAFFLGLMTALPDEYGAVSQRMPFDSAKHNFFAAARHGLMAQFEWVDGRSYAASHLILDHLLPLAHRGLRHNGVDTGDVDRYLGVIEERVRSGRTGAQWMLDSLSNMGQQTRPNLRCGVLTAAIRENQQGEKPVHQWPLASITESGDWVRNYRAIGQLMTTDLFTVRPADIVDLAATLMDWKHVRHVPVEDDEGRLVGIVSHRDLLRLVARGRVTPNETVTIGDVMKKNPVSTTADTPILEAVRLMRAHNIGCLPIVEGERLVGLVTAHDFLAISERLFEEHFGRSRSATG